MKWTDEINNILEKYGLGSINDTTYIEEGFKEETKTKVPLGQEIVFIENMLRNISHQTLNGNIPIENIENLKKMCPVFNKWGDAEGWFVPFIEVQYSFEIDSFDLIGWVSREQAMKMDLSCPQIQSFFEKKLSPEEFEEFRLHRMFNKEKAIKMILKILSLQEAKMENDPELMYAFDEMRDELASVLTRVYRQERETVLKFRDVIKEAISEID